MVIQSEVSVFLYLKKQKISNNQSKKKKKNISYLFCYNLSYCPSEKKKKKRDAHKRKWFESINCYHIFVFFFLSSRACIMV